MANKFSSYLKKDSLEYNVYKAEERLSAQLGKGINEAKYTSSYLPTVISHLRTIIDENPDLTNEEINTILFKEIDDYAKTVYENAYVFGEYLEYLCCQYLSTHPEKYKEISEKLFTSTMDFENIGFENCKTFDEYLLLYTYSRKRDLFHQIFDGYGEALPPTPDNYKNFDNLLKNDIRLHSKFYFEEYFSLPEVSSVLASDEPIAKKRAKIKEYSTWYRNPRDRKDFELYTNIFLNGSYQYVLSDEEHIASSMRKDLARAVSRTVEQLDSLGHLEDYMVDFVFEMCRMEYPEFANSICENNFPSKEFVEDLVGKSKDLSALYSSVDTMSEKDKARVLAKRSYLNRVLASKKEEIRLHLSKDKLKSALGENFLISSKNLSLESLLALNSFWANRYAKELSLYSQAMFAVHKFDLIDKIRDSKSTFVPVENLQKMLIQMDTFYFQATQFLSKKQEAVKNLRDSDETEYEDGDVEEKILRFSYTPFIKSVSRRFGAEEYASYFDSQLPHSKHDIKEDANWYIRLYNPIFSSYLMKDEMLNVLLLSIGNSNSENFPNAGIILENHQADSTIANHGASAFIPYFPVIGIDAGLSFPVRIHIQKHTLIDFLKSFNGNAMLPIYEGSSDFHDPYKSNSIIATSLIMPLTDKTRALFKKGITKSEFEPSNSPNYHPHARFVSHLAFNSSKKVPAHLATINNSKKKSKATFVRRYINLETGYIYELVNGEFVKVVPKHISKTSKGDDEHGIG